MVEFIVHHRQPFQLCASFVANDIKPQTVNGWNKKSIAAVLAYDEAATKVKKKKTSSSSSSNSAIPASVVSARGRLQALLETHATNSSESEVLKLYQVLGNIVQIAKSRK